LIGLLAYLAIPEIRKIDSTSYLSNVRKGLLKSGDLENVPVIDEMA
jgi:hypothetical protein